MSNARESILASLAATRPAFGLPDRRLSERARPVMPDEPLAFLRARIEAAGGAFQVVSGEDWVAQVDWPLDLAAASGAASATDVYSAFPELPSRGAGRGGPGPGELARLDLCVLRGAFAVVENGAVWQRPGSAFERRAALLAEHLVVVIEGDALVPSLHQAYARIDLATTAFGWFLCGPSKTADIEQALVLGAHGPRSMRLVWRRDDARAEVVQSV